MSEYFDELETRNPERRENDLFNDLPQFLSRIKAKLPAWETRFSGIDTSKINSREELAKLPVMRKPELMEAQAVHPPFGDFVDTSLLAGNRIFMSPGPVWEPQAPGVDPWQTARAFHAAGFRKNDIVHCSIGFSMTPGGAMLDEGIRALGGIVYPAGVGNTEAQVEAAGILKAVAYAGTPDYLQTLLNKAEEMGKDLSSIKRAFVSGGALFPSMRQAYNDRGIQVLQGYATADIGAIAYETLHEGKPCDGMIINENLIVEIVRPGTDDPVKAGEVGEVVVTTFNKAYPLVRFGTGDMSAVIEEASPCGRTNMRIKGWMGRADQRTKIKGMFVDPKQINELVNAVDGLERAKLIVTRQENKDAMVLQAVGQGLNADTLKQQLANIAKLNGSIEIVESIPNDGKVIDDQRDYTA